MLEFMKNHWDECLSVLAIIVAVLPLVANRIKIKHRRVFVNIVDHELITNASATTYDNSEQKKGTILIFAVNLFVPYESFFIEDYEITANLKSGTTSKGIITDGSFTIHMRDGKDKAFSIPQEYNFNLHREIVSEKDNIRIVKIMFTDVNIVKIEDIKNIDFVFENNKEKKSITISGSHFPKFNKMKFLSNFMKDINGISE